MEVETILDEIRDNNYSEQIWLAISMAKIRSEIIRKTGVDLIATGAIQPALIQKLMNICTTEVAEEIVKRQGWRN